MDRLMIEQKEKGHLFNALYGDGLDSQKSVYKQASKDDKARFRALIQQSIHLKKPTGQQAFIWRRDGANLVPTSFTFDGYFFALSTDKSKSKGRVLHYGNAYIVLKFTEVKTAGKTKRIGTVFGKIEANTARQLFSKRKGEISLIRY